MNDLFPIIDSALSSAAARSGAHLACRPGCHQCCIGVFAISPLDAEELREALAAAPQEIAGRIRARALVSRERLLAAGFPGNAQTGILFTEPHHEEEFEEFANDEPCPVLDPATGTCELYAARPVQCRTFGPPMRDDEGHLAVCELCFTSAAPEEVARCEMDQSWRALEEKLISEAESHQTNTGPMLIAFALTR